MTRIPQLGPNGEGWLALQLAIIGLVVVGAAFGPTIPVDPRDVTLLRLIGTAAIAVGMVLIAASSTILRRAGSFRTVPRPRPSGVLVQSGPYRLVRHPLYAGLVLASIGAAVYQQSVVTLALAGLLFVVLDLKRRREEAWLIERHPSYDAYRARTRALVPFVY